MLLSLPLHNHQRCCFPRLMLVLYSHAPLFCFFLFCCTVHPSMLNAVSPVLTTYKDYSSSSVFKVLQWITNPLQQNMLTASVHSRLPPFLQFPKQALWRFPLCVEPHQSVHLEHHYSSIPVSKSHWKNTHNALVMGTSRYESPTTCSIFLLIRLCKGAQMQISPRFRLYLKRKGVCRYWIVFTG